MKPCPIEARHDLSPQDIDGLEDRLYAFNKAAVGIDDGRGLAFVARDEAGGMIGAAAGYSWAGIAEIKQVWVEESRRGEGLGRSLVEAFVAEAAARGCRKVFLLTHSFQAPWLYEKLGFTRVATIEDMPLGHAQFVYRRDLDEA